MKAVNLHPKNYSVFTWVALLFASVFGSISLVNHYLIRTYALDLGVYTNALYDYCHLQWNDSTSFKEVPENLLADHFDLYLIIFAPLSLLFKTYTLLLVQWVAILFGGLGIYKFFLLNNSSKFASLAAVYFFLFFGIYSALSFDYHSNVVASMVVPWFFLFLKKHNIRAATGCFIFILIGKENMSLWMVFICIGLLFDYWNSRAIRNALFFYISFSLLYFVAITEFVMPAFSNTGSYPHFHFSVLGKSSAEAFQYLISHPIACFQMLFTNHSGNAQYNFIKIELLALLLVSGLPILFFRPHYLLMLLPVFGQKLFHDNPAMWGIHNQYSIEFAPIMTIGIFVFISQLKNKKHRNRLVVLLPVLAIATTIRLMDNTVMYTDKNKVRIYKKEHFGRDYSIKIVANELSKLPPNAIVSAQSPFLAQLAYRDFIYQFPNIGNADYVVFSYQEGFYPLDEAQFKEKTTSLIQDKDWEIHFQHQDFFIR